MTKDDVCKAYSPQTSDGDTACRLFEILKERKHLESFGKNLQIPVTEK
jgi:hypothetical protein